ncbi:MAG: T9SS type A sorting domain-containing protein, partial [Saprospiraceae bacterium]|nr:T9SS type A sorting domain-containing protein [Saprospiraceae bacterium]
NDWVDYHDGLPFLMGDVKHVLKPFYKDSKIRMSSVRGLWEAPLAQESMPLAYPMTSTNIISCSRDTVQFDCHSILNHAGASWTWTISPEPLWFEGEDIRNPRALLADGESYDVTLSVMDGQGNTSTKTIPSMISVSSQCEPERLAGNSLQVFGNGDWAQINELNFEANELSISAWIKPNGIQPDYSGIVMNDGTPAGLNFRGGNNTLGYHWPGGAWWWDSGLVVPPDVWSHVAMVASPTSMKLYVNGIESVHEVNLDPVLLTSLKIGSYQGWGGRNVNGEIDEVCIWEDTKSTVELRGRRHLTKYTIGSPGLINYYQFNEAAGSALDRIGIKHASLVGNSVRTISTAPVAQGGSQAIMINQPGVHDFWAVGVDLVFGNSSPVPEGWVVVGKLLADPDSLYNEFILPEEYWIANNYGSNSNIEIESIEFYDLMNIPDSIVANPSNAVLIHRIENEHLNNWEVLCSASQIENGRITFSSGCNFDQLGQFHISFNPCDPDAVEIPDNGIDEDCDGEDLLTAVSNVTESAPRVFPNPVSDYLSVEVPGGLDWNFVLYDASGKIVLGNTLQAQIDVRGLSKGIYLLELNQASIGTKWRKRIVVIN